MLGVLPMSAQVEVKSSLDSTEIYIGSQAHITLDVTLKNGMKLVLPEYKPLEHITPGVEVLEQSVADTSKLDNDMLKVSRTYTLTSFDENIYYIPPMNVKVDGKEYKSRELALKVFTVEVDTLHPENFYPPKDVQNNPFMWEDWSGLFGMSMLLAVLVVIAYYLFTRLRENKPVIAKVRFVKRVPPHQKAMSEIERIKADKLAASENQKEYYTKLADTLRKYIEERFGFNAMEMTSSEIISGLQANGDSDMIMELRSLFETADLVKFAKYSTQINENDNNLVNAIQFINTTKAEDLPQVERVEPKLTNEEKLGMRYRRTLKWAVGVLVAVCAAILLYIIYNAATLLSYELEIWSF
ncbi:BatD family protein [Prevotella sp.]|uniref:BatD family protein n=1 Tax=Prevotella sp. TaxID=59823 RepID=UPI0039C4496E